MCGLCPMRFSVRFIFFTDSGRDMGLCSVIRVDAWIVFVWAAVRELSTALHSSPHTTFLPLAAFQRCESVGLKSLPQIKQLSLILSLFNLICLLILLHSSSDGSANCLAALTISCIFMVLSSTIVRCSLSVAGCLFCFFVTP